MPSNSSFGADMHASAMGVLAWYTMHQCNHGSSKTFTPSSQFQYTSPCGFCTLIQGPLLSHGALCLSTGKQHE